MYLAENEPIGIAESGRVANVGATFSPQYIERNPPMWALGETDMKALSIAGAVANVFFALGSFLVGCCVNILVSYGNSEKLTPVAEFLLYKASWVVGGISIVFFVVGAGFTWSKRSLWNQIKSESRPVTPGVPTNPKLDPLAQPPSPGSRP
jgi:hypothetical protein